MDDWYDCVGEGGAKVGVGAFILNKLPIHLQWKAKESVDYSMLSI